MAEDFGPNGALQGIVKEPKLEAQDKSLQQDFVDWAADNLQGRPGTLGSRIGLSVDPYTAYKYSRKIFGDMNSADPEIPLGIGLTDFTPMGAVFALDQAKRDFEDVGKKFEEGDTLGGAIDAGLATGLAALSVAEIVPGIRMAAKPVKGFLRSLGGKLPQTAPSMVSGPNTAPMEKLIQLKPMTDQFGTEVPDAQKYLDSASKSPPLYDEANRGAIVAPEVDRATEVAEMRRQANIERFGYDPNSLDEVTEVDTGFEEYRQRVDPGGRIIPAEDRPNLAMGDMYGMLPKNAEAVKELDNGVTLHRGANGDYYATAYNPDVGEQDVVGYIQGRDNGTELAVVQEMQGSGIGSELQYLFRSENPSAPTGGLTEAGARRLEGTYKRLDAEGLITPEAPVVDKIIPEPPAADIDPQGFYSEVSRAVDALPQNKGNGSQMLAMIAKSPGVKAEEMSWTGLDDFLKGKKNVTKAEIQEYVDANQVRIEEVVKGGRRLENDDLERLREIEATNTVDEYEFEYDPDEGGFVTYLYDEPLYDFGGELRVASSQSVARQEAYEEALESARNMPDTELLERYGTTADDTVGTGGYTKFGEYTLPGGENYRELLLTLPKKAMTFDEYAAEYKRRVPGIDDATIQERYPDYAAAPGDDLAPDTFRGGHYGGEHPNVIAHIRLNDRTGPDGQRILFVEEIQSDWHQKGRETGYQTPTGKLSAEKMEKVGGEVWEVRDQSGQFITNITSPMSRLDNGELVEFNIKSAEDAILMAQEQLDNSATYNLSAMKNRVPDAPLKKTWQEASLRRVMRMAAEEGYDSVAWTPGRVQAERYDLSSQIDELRAIRNDDGTFRIYGVESRTGPVGILMEQDNVKPADLENLVGKHLAEKIHGQNKVEEAYFDTDLEVGGEGMKGFYDKMIKNYANKFGKKFGAKVGTTKIQTDGPASVLEVVENQADGFTVVDKVNGGQVRDFSTRAEAEQFIQNELVDTEVWNLPITKKMRDSVLKGVPLFGAAVAAGQESNEEKESF